MATTIKILMIEQEAFFRMGNKKYKCVQSIYHWYGRVVSVQARVTITFLNGFISMNGIKRFNGCNNAQVGLVNKNSFKSAKPSADLVRYVGHPTSEVFSSFANNRF